MSSKRQRRRRHHVYLTRRPPTPRPPAVSGLTRLCELVFGVPKDIFHEARGNRTASID